MRYLLSAVTILALAGGCRSTVGPAVIQPQYYAITGAQSERSRKAAWATGPPTYSWPPPATSS
ncbi:hypothetical protein [Neolewinella sp.]|uniref:hypothetical protein n=1 Tax=Neolewinella sp. TaxID=2993543 RepID=UPI003B51BA5B